MPAPTGTTQRNPRMRAAIIGGAIIVALALGAIWWFAARATPAEAEAATTSGEVRGPAGAPRERADGLPKETHMSVNELKVRDLAAVRGFYENAVGMTVLDEGEGEVLLGLGDEPLIKLIASDQPLPQPEEAGLYHTAILFPDEATLANTLLRVAQQAPNSYQGAADHAVSRAFYFGDPENNGVELYVDRPEDEWVWQDGKVVMGSEALDPNQFIDQYGSGDASGTATVGHVHLKVGNLDEARAFYADTLGFDVVSEADGALFYSAGGYHHHLATNTWMSAGAGPRSTEVGLGAVTVALPDAASVDAVADRLAAADIEVTRIERGIAAADPWGNQIRLVTPGE